MRRRFVEDGPELIGKYVPYVEINGVASKAATGDLVGAICSAYAGRPKPYECSHRTYPSA